MKHSPSPKANSVSVSHEIILILWNPNFHYSDHVSPPLVLIMCRISPVHTHPTEFLKNQFNIIFLVISSGLFPSWFPTTNLYTFRLSTIRATCPAHPILHYPNNVWWVQIITFLIMQSHPSSCYLFPLRPKCYPQHSFLTLLIYPRSLFSLSFFLIFMEPCIVLWLVAISNKMQLSNGILLFHSTLIVQHVSSIMSLIIRNLNCICSFWFTYACGDRPWCRLSGNWPVPTQTAPQAVSTSVCKLEAANTVEVPDDKRHNARNMLNY